MIGSFRRIPGLRGELLESPVWDARRKLLYCCDILGRTVAEVCLDRGLVRQWSFDSEVGSLGLCDSGRLVVALRRTVVLFDTETGSQTTLWTGFEEPENHRLNDGKVGPDGAFWVGGMVEGGVGDSLANLYRIDPSGASRIVRSGLSTSNGLAWSADGRTMYHSDSRVAWIDRYDFDPVTGWSGNARRFQQLDEAKGRPDGGTCDASDHYWSAGVSAGVLNRFAPDGTPAGSFPVPTPAPTMPCFCGPSLRQIVVTSHRKIDPDVLANHPDAGGLFIAEVDERGFPPSRFQDLASAPATSG